MKGKEEVEKLEQQHRSGKLILGKGSARSAGDGLTKEGKMPNQKKCLYRVKL